MTFPRYSESPFGRAFLIQPPSTFVRRPRMLEYFWKTSAVAESFTEEAKSYAFLDRNPHPNLIRRLGALVNENRAVGLILAQLTSTVFDAVMEEKHVDAEKVVTQLRAEIKHLHGLGYFHNDVHLNNIMMDGCGNFILIDYELARRVGTEIPHLGKLSSFDIDNASIERVVRELTVLQRRNKVY